jgi:heat shock protein HslJ
MRRQFTYLLLLSGVLLIFGCAANQSSSSGSKDDGRLITPHNFKDITGIEWALTQMTNNNETIALAEGSQTTFACDEGGRVTGKATINRYSGSLKLQADGDIIWSKAFMMTRMAGPPELMQQETIFIQALMKTSRMFLNESKLVFRSHDGKTVMEFDEAK